MAERVFAMPDLGEGLEEGTVVSWLVAEGDAVVLNQPLVEVETAKATVEIPSPFTGVVLRLHGAADEDVPVGAPLVTFEVDAPDGGSTSGGPARAEVVAAYDPVIERRPDGGPERGKVRATPAVRKLAKDMDVDLATVRGTGPSGRVTEQDVRRVAELRGSVGNAVGVTVPEDLGIERIATTPIRREIAEKLSLQAAIPQVTTFRTVDCGALQALREELGVSPLPIVVAALARTIPQHPLLNAAWTDTAIELRERVNVGIAVETDRGLVVPVVQDAAHRGIRDLADEIGRLAGASRGRSLPIEDLVATATIAVSNTGSYGSEAGTPILSPGTSVTIALGVIAPRALVVDGDVVARPAATLSLTFDHRVLDGAAAGRALTDLVAVLQSEDRLRDLPR